MCLSVCVRACVHVRSFLSNLHTYFHLLMLFLHFKSYEPVTGVWVFAGPQGCVNGGS